MPNEAVSVKWEIAKDEHFIEENKALRQELDLYEEDIRYEVADYPLWVDTAAVRLREIARLDALAKTLRRQMELLQKELLSTAQRVNLFEKVKIPEAKENIRVIGIYLGDQQTSAVVRGKIAKKKLQEVSR